MVVGLTAWEHAAGRATPLEMWQRLAYGALSLVVAWRLRPGVPARLVLYLATALATLSLGNSLVYAAVDGGANSPHASFFALALVASAFVLFYPLWFCALFYAAFTSAFIVVCCLCTPEGAPIAHALQLAIAGAVGGFGGTLVLRAMARQIVDNQRVLREEAQEATLATERSRIARDLHDHVGARLTGIALLAEREQKAVPPNLEEPLQLIHQTIRLCLEEIRDVVWALSHERREMPDALATLRRRAEDMAEAAGLSLTVDADPRGLPPSLDATTSLALLSIVREALTNVVKHSSAKSVQIRVAQEAQHLCLEVLDDGKGLGATQTAGRGLYNMQARAEEQRGTFTLEPRAGGGLAVRVRLPIA